MNAGETWEMTSGPEDMFPWIITVLCVTTKHITFLILSSEGSEFLEGTTMEMPLGWSEEVPESWRML